MSCMQSPCQKCTAKQLAARLAAVHGGCAQHTPHCSRRMCAAHSSLQAEDQACAAVHACVFAPPQPLTLAFPQPQARMQLEPPSQQQPRHHSHSHSNSCHQAPHLQLCPGRVRTAQQGLQLGHQTSPLGLRIVAAQGAGWGPGSGVRVWAWLGPGLRPGFGAWLGLRHLLSHAAWPGFGLAWMERIKPARAVPYALVCRCFRYAHMPT